MEQPNAFAGNIPYRLVKELHDDYIAGKHETLSANMDKKETKSIWFAKEDIVTFLEEVMSDDKVSGIRVYFIQYPKEQKEMYEQMIPKDPNDVNQLSIALVTTKKDSETRHTDYPESAKGTKMMVAPPMNHGQLCPTKCND